MLLNNPVLYRESRVRWRGWRPFALLFLYAMSLAYVLGWSYATNSAGNALSGSTDNLAATGREVFRTLQMMQMVAWLLIVPILTSTIISSERERGLLEALQLSGLRARQIITGKLGAISLFVVVLLLAGAPITSICFILGGVAPEEFLKSLLLQTLTILLCAAIGLFYSSQARRSLIAARNSFIAMLIFAVGTGFAFDLNEATGFDFLEIPAAMLTLLNPIRAQIAIFDDFTTAYSSLPPIIPHPFRFTLCSLFFYALLFLWGAARGVKKVFDDTQFLERKRYLTLRKGRFTWRDAQVDQETLARWQNERALATEADLKEKTTALFDTPLAAFIRFRNPILQREVKGKLRLRRYPKPVTFFMSSIAVFGGVAYLWGVYFAWVEAQSRNDFWGICLTIALLGITFVLPLMGAGALARERDNGTWEMLETSLLSPRHLIAGKLLAPLFFALCAFVLLLPFLLPCIRFFDTSQSSIYTEGPSLPYALSGLCLLATTSFCYTAWGLWLSWHFRTPVTAMAVTLISMLLLLAFVPWLLSLFVFENASNSQSLTDFLNLWHPWVTFFQLFDSQSGNSSHYHAENALPCTVLQLSAGSFLLWDLKRRLSKAWRLPRHKTFGIKRQKLTLTERTGENVQPKAP